MIVSLIAAVSEDGKIARSVDERSTNWTSKEDTQFYVQSIKQADAIIVGRKTFETIRRFPINSNWYVFTSQSEKFVNPKPQVIKAIGWDQPPSALIAHLRSLNYQNVVICGGSSLYTQFLTDRLVNKVMLTVEPQRFGQGVGLLTHPLTQDLSLKHLIALSDQTIVFEYQVA